MDYQNFLWLSLIVPYIPKIPSIPYHAHILRLATLSLSSQRILKVIIANFEMRKIQYTRMHSSRMCTACGSKFPRGVSASVHAGIHTRGVGLETPMGVGPETPQMWAWRPPGCGPPDPLGQTPPGQAPQLPLCVWAWRPPPQVWAWRLPRDLRQGMLGYHPPWTDRHM